ncbi:endothelin-converting enzyme 1 [Ceratocystis lukuohia]|uniref:Endothelin-converting enzyme 1 n=1 Tax=Ceratocystis lukuohia TaxID=2019550 RepID=A0ABR4MA44_9PEZI
MVFSSVFVLGLLAYAIDAQSESASYTADHEAAPTSNPGYCNTPACQRIAADLRSNLPSNYADLDPCSSFEELACSGWRLKHELKPGQHAVTTTTLIQDHIDTIIREIGEGPLPAGIDSSSQDAKNFYKMKAIYNACMDVDTIKDLGIGPLKKVLAEMDGAESIKDSLLILLTNDITGLVTIAPVFDDIDPDQIAVGLTAPMDFVQEVLPMFYPETTPETMVDLVLLEEQIASLSPLHNKRLNLKELYDVMTLEEVNALLPELGIRDIINTLAPRGVPIKRVIVRNAEYFLMLPGILRSVSPDTLKAYFRWCLITRYEPFLEDRILKPLKDLRNLSKFQGSRQDQCITHVDQSVGAIMSRFFIEKAFSPAAKDLGKEIVANLKNAYIEKLRLTQWMDEDSTEQAVKKVLNMKEKIGYPTVSPKITDPDDLAHMYRDAVVSDRTHFENEVSLRHMKLKVVWESLGKPTDLVEWQINPNEANAHYVRPRNSLMLPAGLMQYPNFDVDVPAYITYGAYGFIVGHEISHAFDSSGHLYDETGALSEASGWWTPNTEAAFSARTQCFVNQYSGLVNEVLHGDVKIKNYVDGENSLDENIADASGLSASYLAWKQLDNEGKGGDLLPGLDFFTRDQLFFLSFANHFCGNFLARDGHISRRKHLPGWARITGSLANSEEFLKAFNCPAKEPTCKMW